MQPGHNPAGYAAVPALPGRWITPLRGRFAVFAVLKIVGWALGYVVVTVALLLGTSVLREAPPSPAGMLIVLLVGTTVVMLLALWLHVVVPLGGRWDLLGVRRPERSALHLLWQIPSLMVVAGLVELLATAPFTASAEPDSIAESITGATPTVWLLAALTTSVAVPIWEELFFRGLVFGALRASLPLAAAAPIAGVVFGAAHVVVIALPYLVVMGIGLCLLAEWYRSVLPGMVVHGVNNGIVALSLLSTVQLT